MRSAAHRAGAFPRPFTSGGGRGGFTLVEVLLALAMMMLVLAAAYSGLTLFQRVTVAGRRDAERSQLARAIERRIAADVRCVLFREAEAEPVEEEGGAAGEEAGEEGEGSGESSEGGGAAGNDLGNSFSGTGTGSSTPPEPTVPVTPSEAYASEEVGLFGDATMLVLHVAKPPRGDAVAPPQGSTSLATAVAPLRSDLRSICYLLATPGADGLQGAVSDAAADGLSNTIVDRRGRGLARLDADRMTMGRTDPAEPVGDVAVLPGQAAVLAEEVTELGFRYYDGAAWLTEWNSAELNALPRAVEVTVRIDVDRADEPTNQFLAAPPPSASDVYRFVVALPHSDPTLGLEEL